jgi:hypothetical protein
MVVTLVVNPALLQIDWARFNRPPIKLGTAHCGIGVAVGVAVGVGLTVAVGVGVAVAVGVAVGVGLANVVALAVLDQFDELAQGILYALTW